VTRLVVRAPRSDNEDLCVPNHGQLCGQVIENHHRWDRVSGQSWINRLRRRAREQVALVAKRYAQAYTVEPTIDDSMLWVVGGHQPELFHPGVWFKNVLIDKICAELSSSHAVACGVHVIIDHDLPKSFSIRVPHRVDHDRQEHVGIDICQLPIQGPKAVGQVALPWHSYRIDYDRIESFVGQIERDLQSLSLPTPMARAFFGKLSKLGDSTNAAIAFSQARHMTERQHGMRNIDLPMSLVCQTQAWYEFVEHCIGRADHLIGIYNGALESYRAREGITNPGQPVAQLSEANGWIELPFWLYRTSDLARNRMWFRLDGPNWELGSGARPDQLAWTMPVASHQGGLEAAILQRADQGVCVRPRALVTTLFLRCFLADGFVHGIGGGLYDRLTDDIIRGFLEIDPPSYAIATATLHLPVPEFLRQGVEIAQKEYVGLIQRSRAIRSAPESFLNPTENLAQALVQERAELLTAIPLRGHKKPWHRRMVDLKTRIRQVIDPMVQNHQQALQAAQRRVHEAQLLGSREYSMVLFPESDCIGRLKELASRVRA